MTAESGMAVGETAQAKGPDEPQAIRKYTSVNPGQGRRAAFLIVPTIVLLGVVIIYPIISAVVLSFTKDPGLDKATGTFVSGGSAGFSNYTHWLLQQCNSATGQISCPPGNHRLAVLRARRGHLLLHRRLGRHRGRPGHVVRADHEPQIQGPRASCARPC